MTNIRRYLNEGNIYFLTHVTYNRQEILTTYFDLLWESIGKCKKDNDFELIAWVVLPDHIHMIINPKENNLSTLIKKIKLSFSMKYLKEHNLKSGKLWQNRFWDHIIRDQNDMNRHIDYIHYNPVKHQVVKSPFEWKYSSIKEYSDKKYYQKDWGVNEKIKFEGNFGE